MTTKTLFAATVFAVGLTVPAHAEEAAGPVYLLADLKVSNLEQYMENYGFPVTPMLLEAGAEIIVATPQVEVLEGDYAPNWSVVVRFPSEAAAKRWYASDEYRAMIPLRHGLTDQDASTMVLAPQFSMPEQ
ncbi:MAG: DUF1330 domain-containing protein [Pseudomonadota bacterium]